MAKLSGPEEFFEVFNDKQAGRPPADRLSDDHPVEARIAPAPRDKTVTIQVRTLVIGCISAALLIALSYFVGLSNRPEAQPPGPLAGWPADPADVVESPDSPGGQPVGVGQDPAGTPNASPGTGGQAVTAPRKAWVLKLVTSADNEKNRKSAADVVRYVKERVDVAAYGKYVFIHVPDGSRFLIVCVGPFSSKDSDAALKMKDAIGQLRPYKDVNFQKACFETITPRQ